MTRMFALAAVVGVSLSMPADRGQEGSNAVTWTGWFSDKSCAHVRDGGWVPTGHHASENA